MVQDRTTIPDDPPANETPPDPEQDPTDFITAALLYIIEDEGDA